MKRINLSELPKQDPFLKPAGYLENLPQQVQKRVSATPLGLWAAMSNILAYSRLQLVFTMAFLLIAGLVFFQQDKAAVEPAANVILNNTTEQEIINYLSNSSSISILELSDGGLESDIYAIELNGEDMLENEIILNIDSYSSEELWK